jgi:methylmalonyl-CoA/ethylmalonyl-CoA epimerase
VTKPAAPAALSEIGQIAITVQDLERASAFYRDVLGLEPLFQVPGMSFFRCGGVRLLLGTEGDSRYPPIILYYRVADIHAAHARLAGRGVVFEREPCLVHKAQGQELWLAFFRDADGHMAALMSEVAAR